MRRWWIRLGAVGEIGLDLHWDTSTLDMQKEALQIQLDWAKRRNLPVVIHVRKAFKELFEVLDEAMDDRLTGVVHCFTGGLAEAEHILTYPGWMLGIGGVPRTRMVGWTRCCLTCRCRD